MLCYPLMHTDGGLMKTVSFTQILANRRIGIMLPLGFASGLPLALTAGTLQAWLTVAGLDLKTIGIFTLVGLPYTLKFLWAPFMDRLVPPWLGRRRGWMLVMQLCVARFGGHGVDWPRPASGDTRGPGSRGGVPLCFTRYCLRRLSDRCALTSGTGIRCRCCG